MILEERKLFGGGISIKVPKTFKDVSTFRQVPDNQEVFVSPDSDANLIIELLETPSDAVEAEFGIRYPQILKLINCILFLVSIGMNCVKKLVRLIQK